MHACELFICTVRPDVTTCPLRNSAAAAYEKAVVALLVALAKVSMYDLQSVLLASKLGTFA